MLVSVAVITYNSSKTILETLNSILIQSYGSQNIELIISDDASQDNTVAIIEDWLTSNQSYFSKVVFIRNPINQGVSCNINKAWKKVSSDWVKSIAGDDLLHPKCIELNVKYVNSNPNCRALFSKMQMFGRFQNIIPTPYELKWFKKNREIQYKYFKSFAFNIAPSSFLDMNILREIGYADEKYKMLEDLPLWLKIIEYGYKLHFLDEITVYYRMHDSISTVTKERYINPAFIKELILVYTDQGGCFLKNPCMEWVRMEKLINYKLMIKISEFNNNEKNRNTKILNTLLWLVRPAHTLNYLISIIYNNIYSEENIDHK